MICVLLTQLICYKRISSSGVCRCVLRNMITLHIESQQKRALAECYKLQHHFRTSNEFEHVQLLIVELAHQILSFERTETSNIKPNTAFTRFDKSLIKQT